MDAYEKKYKEALELARDYYKANQILGESEENEVLSDIFPELKESEDERIRKEITELVMRPTWKTEKEFHRRKELCAWLEKLSEQNLANSAKSC